MELVTETTHSVSPLKADSKPMGAELDTNHAIVSSANVDPPVDRYNLVKIGFLLQGLGMLLPWNACLTITNYWSYKLQGSEFMGNYMNYFTFINCSILFFTSGGFSRMQHKLGLHSRVSIPIIIEIVIFIVHLALVYVDAAHGDTFFYITISLIIICSVCIGFQEPGVYSVVAFLPDEYTGWAVQGEAWGGVTISMINIFTLLGATDIQTAACAFFATSIALLVLCLINYQMLINSEVFRYWYAYQMSVKLDSVAQEQEKCEEEGEAAGEVSTARFLHIIRKTLDLSFAVWYNFCMTLMIFPVLPMSVAPLTQSTSRFFGDMWVPVYVFLFFNLFDVIGRIITPLILCPRSWVAPLSFLRTILLPLFLMCNGKCYDAATATFVDSQMPKVFMNDAWPITFQIILGLSNGYVFHAAMHYTPASVKGHERPVANSIVTTCLIFGLLTGSLASFGSKAINCGGNPFA